MPTAFNPGQIVSGPLVKEMRWHGWGLGATNAPRPRHWLLPPGTPLAFASVGATPTGRYQHRSHPGERGAGTDAAAPRHLCTGAQDRNQIVTATITLRKEKVGRRPADLPAVRIDAPWISPNPVP